MRYLLDLDLPRSRRPPLLIAFDCDGVVVDTEIIAARVDAELLTREGFAITPAEVTQLVTEGRTALITDFVSKRGSKFSAFLVLSEKQDKADFEFPPR